MDDESSTPVPAPWMDDDGILVVEIGSRPRTIDDFDRTVAAIARLTQGRRRPMFVDATSVTQDLPTKAFMKAVAWLPTVASAIATVVGDESPNQIATYQGAMDSLLLPARLFTDPDEARAWLLQQGSNG